MQGIELNNFETLQIFKSILTGVILINKVNMSCSETDDYSLGARPIVLPSGEITTALSPNILNSTILDLKKTSRHSGISELAILFSL